MDGDGPSRLHEMEKRRVAQCTIHLSRPPHSFYASLQELRLQEPEKELLEDIEEIVALYPVELVNYYSPGYPGESPPLLSSTRVCSYTPQLALRIIHLFLALPPHSPEKFFAPRFLIEPCRRSPHLVPPNCTRRG